MKQKLNTLALFGAIAALCGCTSVSVKTDYSQAASFGQYHTYALRQPVPGIPLTPSDEALRNALRENLAARGLREVSANERPQLAVVPSVVTRKQYAVEQLNDWPYGGGMGAFGFGSYGGGWAAFPAYYNPISYTEGILLLDFVDTSTREVVFRGEAKGVVGSEEQNVENTEEAVKQIVAKLPASTGEYAAR